VDLEWDRGFMSNHRPKISIQLFNFKRLLPDPSNLVETHTGWARKQQKSIGQESDRTQTIGMVDWDGMGMGWDGAAKCQTLSLVAIVSSDRRPGSTGRLFDS
jgi:hypothetical protein